jgi:hypothetical protein
MNDSAPKAVTPDKCQKCGADFACLASDIKACHCSQVQLTREQHQYIEARWKGCLCRPCLAEIASGKTNLNN